MIGGEMEWGEDGRGVSYHVVLFTNIGSRSPRLLIIFSFHVDIQFMNIDMYRERNQLKFQRNKVKLLKSCIYFLCNIRQSLVFFFYILTC